jgi:environmental stress-induced protein Ves
MRLLRAADHRLTRWKNGMGETREVIALPDPENPAGFLWRVSMATVAADGPFSHFPGIDRSIAVMQGQGMRLDVDGLQLDVLNGGAPYSFAGEANVSSILIDGPTVDLNAMSLRSSWSHKMTRLDAAPTVEVIGRTAVSVLVFNGPATLNIGSGDQQVEQFDALASVAPGDGITVTGAPAIDAFLIEFDQLR